MTLLFLILLITTEPARPVAPQSCLSYEPDTVSLKGKIKRRTFAGPPNYESVAKGDRPERMWVLHLSRPICVSASGDRQEEKNVSDLQLVFKGAEDYRRYRSFVGKRATVDGTLFHAQTGHHYTPVLLTVTRISK
ncbi:MAG TPA: DUF4431 domain-containing protein [Pyrinomonadaceae bacterium]|nr:DUF4431 domain-containing protein [Pyrinomonadaceae bacterium]